MTIMAENTFSGSGNSGSTARSETQTRVFFSSKHGYTVKYAGFGLYVLQGRKGGKVVRKLDEILDTIEVVYGKDEVEELKRGLGVDE